MNREANFNLYKIGVAVGGAIAFAVALLNLDAHVLDWKFAVILLSSMLVAPRMSVMLPRSRFVVSFSDALVFLSFMYFGGPAAVIIAVAEMLATCLYYKFRGAEFTTHTINFNLGSAAISTGISAFAFHWIPPLTGIDTSSAATTDLMATLGLLAMTQFGLSSVMSSFFYALKKDIDVWTAWKTDGLPVSVTHFAGAGLAGITYKIFNYGDVYSIVVSFIAFVVIYYNYRQIIGEMSASIEQAEQAERDRAEAEREKRLEIEKYAEELALSLKKEEEIGKELRRSEREFQHSALHDSLTQLANRANFVECVKELIAEIRNGGEQNAYVLFLDLARFKSINDSLGHSIGDKVLMVVARRFKKMLRPGDIVARLGGDEFAIILRGLASVEKAEKVAWKIHQNVARPFTLSKSKIHTSVNIGIAPVRSEYKTPEEVLRDADIAMHHGKETGESIAIFNTELRQRFMEQAILEAELPFAIERGEFSMHYQPLISLHDGSIIGFEALLRWFHRDNIFISPARFIPIAEHTGLIVPITRWILRETCTQLAEWQRLSYATKDLVVSVNISGKHLSNFNLIEDVKRALRESKLSPSSLKLEITESAAMENALETIQILTSLKQLGVQLSIDDFGTGYSSLSYLHRLPVDTLKIDRSFVNTVGEHGEDSEILQTIITLAKNLRLRVIAEGIETENQLNILRDLGCDYGQGYLMSKPMPKDQMAELLHRKTYWLPRHEDDGADDSNHESAADEQAVVF